MVDNINPTSQFHPYQRPSDTPVAERQTSGLGGLNWQDSFGRVRDYARQNPSKTLSALAAIVIGAGLMRQRGR